MDRELFSLGAVHAMNRRFPNIEKVSPFDSSDLATDIALASLNFNPNKEYYSARSGSKIISATVNQKPCILRYFDMTQNVEAQTETLTYLSILKTFRHSHLEEVATVGLVELGTGRIKDTKVYLNYSLVVSRTFFNYKKIKDGGCIGTWN